LIESDTLSFDFDIDTYFSSKKEKIHANLTFGKYNTTLNQSSMKIVEANSGKKGYLIRSSGFKFEGKAFDFPSNSFV